MRVGYAHQYERPCIILEPKDDYLDVIRMAEEEGAVFMDGPDVIDDKCYVIQFPGRPQELYTFAALARSFPI